MGKKRNMPYVRTEYIPGAPGIKVRFKVGGGTNYDIIVKVVSKEDATIKQESIEAARASINNRLQKTVGEGNYTLIVKPYPHVIIREHKMLTGAGADRLSEGMRRAFGKPTTRGAKVSRDQEIFEIRAFKKDLPSIKEAIEIGLHKLPIEAKIVSEEVNEQQ
ncbi:50S ribosomal protein L16 [archaeon]|jgi:large subunit ribosomal protein L10e|nr:50S ribosomal protein L16 [archaeon]NHV05855.1 50S ribosomal protein L16 [Nitrososphaerota archaeon]